MPSIWWPGWWRPHSYCHDLTPDHAEQLHYDRTRTLNPEEALTQ